MILHLQWYIIIIVSLLTFSHLTFSPFFPVSTPGFDSNAGNLTYFQKLPFYFVYIENTCKIYFWGEKKD